MYKMNDLNYFDKNYLIINYINNKNKTEKTIKFYNDKIPIIIKKNKKQISKSNNDLDLDIDIENNEKINTDIKTLCIYPTDSLLDLKKKISLLFGLEWYKITLYWNLNNTHETSYYFYIKDVKYEINNFNDIYNNKDKFFYENKNNIHCVAKDEFTLVSYLICKNIKCINFIYLDDFNVTSNNNNELDFNYYSYIIKYFPFFTNVSYYDLMMTKNFKEKYYHNINLINYITQYSYIKNILSLKSDNNEFFYKKIKLSLKLKEKNILIRNLFDLFKTSENNIIKLIYINNNKVYIKKNIYDYNKINISYTSINGCSFVINNKYNTLKPIYLTLKNNEELMADVHINISDQFQLKYIDICNFILEIINNILDKLNDNIYYFNILNKLNKFTINDITNYDTINKCVISHKFINNKFNLNDITAIQKELMKYDFIITNVEIKNNVVNCAMHYGVSDFNLDVYYNFYPYKKNYYSIYTNNDDMNNWRSKYLGALINIYFDKNYVYIDIKNINNNDVFSILVMIKNILLKINTKNNNIKELESNKNLKKLKIIDPVLFSYEESKNNDKKYSKICQKPFQPMAYNQKDYDEMPINDKKKLMKYKNMTNDENIYYKCPNKKAPHLGFILNEHPDNYCLPCCRVKEQTYKLGYEECKKNNIFKDEKDKINNDYILSDLKEGRYSKLPKVLDIIFNISLKDNDKFYNFGIFDLYRSLSFCLDKNINNLNDLYKNKVNVLVFDIKGNMNNSMYYNYNNYILLYNNKHIYIPIVNTKKKIYNSNDKIIKLLNGVLTKHYNSFKNNFFTYKNIKNKYNIQQVFVNSKKYIYGVLIKYKNNILYIPVIHVFNIYNEEDTVLAPSIIKNVKHSNLLSFLKDNRFDKYEYVYSKYNETFIGLKICDNNNMLTFLFNDEVKINTDNHIHLIHYPLFKIQDKIFKSQYSLTPINYTMDYYYMYYKNLYRLILSEITSYLTFKKNDIKRLEIINIIKDNKNYNVVKNLIEEIAYDDMVKLNILLVDNFTIKDNTIVFNKSSLNEFTKLINDKKFKFDDDKHEYVEKTYKGISNLFNNLFSYKPMDTISITKDLHNILIPCSINNKNEYCFKNKLIIPTELKNKFVTLFYMDINNDFKNKHILNSIVHINDENDFNFNIDEKITIEPLSAYRVL